MSGKDTPLPSPDILHTPHIHFNSTYVTSSTTKTSTSSPVTANCTCLTAPQNLQPHTTINGPAILENTPRTTLLINHSGTSSEKSDIVETQYFASVTPPTISTNPEITAIDDDSNRSDHSLSKDERLDEIKKQCSQLISELDMNPNPEEIIRKHIIMLNKYNELKDIALGLVTMIADQRHIRTTDILEEVKVEHNQD